MRSQKLADHFATPIDLSDSDKEDIRCYHHSSFMFTRDTYQMSPLLFESDTEDSSQSTEIKCYQEKTITPQLPTPTNNRQIFDILSTLSDLRNENSSQLDASSQHNQCCSESLLDSSHHETKANTYNAYISPSPRVTRSKWLKSRILTRSAKRLHKITEFSEFSESPRNPRKERTKKDVRKEKNSSNDGKVLNRKASDKREYDKKLIETIKKSKVRVVLERLKFPFFQNPHQVSGKFIQPNIVPNIEVDVEDDDLHFLNQRLSSEVQVLTQRPAIISVSSESTIRNVSPPPPRDLSPDLFENFEISSASNLCSQNSWDIPNGQIMVRSAELRVSGSATSTPITQHDSTVVPPILDVFERDCVTPNVNAARQKLLTDGDKGVVHRHTFEITVNEVFDNVIHVSDSEDTPTPEMANPVDEYMPHLLPQPIRLATKDTLVNLIGSTKYASSQEITPKKRPEIRGVLNKSVGACSSNQPTSLNRSKWLSKPRSGNSDSDRSNRTSQRCRRLDLWFHNEDKSRKEGNADRKGRSSKFLLTSSEEDDS